MMLQKTAFIITFALLSAFALPAQTNSTIQKHANSFGNRLYQKCSSGGGKALKSEVYDYGYTKDNVLAINMKVSWNGRITGYHYWIKGWLYVYSNGTNRWQKSEDRGMFVPYCSRGNTLENVLDIASALLLRKNYRKR